MWRTMDFISVTGVETTQMTAALAKRIPAWVIGHENWQLHIHPTVCRQHNRLEHVLSQWCSLNLFQLAWLISASYRQLVWSQSLRSLVRLTVTLRGLHCLLWPEKAFQIYLSCFLSELQRGMFSFPKTSCCFTSTLTSSMFLHFLPRCKVSIWDKTATHSTKFTELKRLLFFKFNFREQQPPNSNNI